MKNKPATLCWSCKRACGGCCWSEYDEEARRMRGQPVPGWVARPALIRGNGHGSRPVQTYHVISCPLYEAEPNRKRCGK